MGAQVFGMHGVHLLAGGEEAAGGQPVEPHPAGPNIDPERIAAALATVRDEDSAQRNALAAVARSQKLVQRILNHSNPNRWAARYAV